MSEIIKFLNVNLKLYKIVVSQHVTTQRDASGKYLKTRHLYLSDDKYCCTVLCQMYHVLS